jgi:hypothetical protein
MLLGERFDEALSRLSPFVASMLNLRLESSLLLEAEFVSPFHPSRVNRGNGELCFRTQGGVDHAQIYGPANAHSGDYDGAYQRYKSQVPHLTP